MTKHFSMNEIRDFWTDQAKAHGTSHNASWSDRSVIEMELRELIKRVDDGHSVLDIGCANGFSTLHLAKEKKINVRGLDFIPEMIKEAKKNLASQPNLKSQSVHFEIGDIQKLQESDNTYDRVIVVRVLINLNNWDNQCKALAECARVLKPGGLLLLSEATIQGWSRLNMLREEWKLSPISEPPFNTYLDEEKVEKKLYELGMEIVEISNFASSYYVGTRLVKPLLAKALNLEIDVANPDMEWNRWWSTLPAAGDYGTQKLFVIRKL